MPELIPCCELKVLHILWSRGSMTVKDLARVIYGNDIEPQHIATTHKLLARLVTKELVHKSTAKYPHIYTTLKLPQHVAAIAALKAITRVLNITESQRLKDSMFHVINGLPFNS